MTETPTSWPGSSLCGSPLVDLCITYAAEAQQKAGMQTNQALPTLAPTLTKRLSHMRNKARLSRSAQEGMEIAGTYRTMRLGFDTSFTWSSSRFVCLSNGAGWIIKFQLGKTLRSSKEARPLLADLDRAEACAVRCVSAYVPRGGALPGEGFVFRASVPGGRGRRSAGARANDAPPREDRVSTTSPSGEAAGPLHCKESLLIKSLAGTPWTKS